MIVKYRVSRSDVWRAYWHLWRTSGRIKLIQLVIFGCVVNVMVLLQSGSDVGIAQRFGIASVTGLFVLACFVLFPQIQFKPEERRLRITPSGLSTTIGKRSGDIPWMDVDRIVAKADCVYIIGTTGNAFSVPNGAFENDAQRLEFIALATDWWRDSRAV